jgi:hypothetical protein
MAKSGKSEKNKKNEKCSLENLKKDYKKIQEKFNLPGFDELNQDFQIEKIAEYETDYILREIRKFVVEKLSNYLRFIESILNPVESQIFIFSVLKTLGPEEKKKLSEIYKKLARNEVEAIEVDVRFSEEKEAEFIRESFILWQEIKEDILGIIEVIKKNWDGEAGTNSRGYFG